MTTLVPKYDEGSAGAVNRPFNLKLAESISVKDFGATGDGSTNDLAAIQAAINSISATGGSVYFPKGTYFIDGPSTDSSGIIVSSSNIKLYGDGASSVLKQSDTSKFVLVLNGTTGQLSNIEICDLYFNGPTLRATYTSTGQIQQHYHLLMVINVDNLHIHDNVFYAPIGDAIALDQAYQNEGAPPYTNARHNKNVWIKNNVIDGFDYNNRNGVSIIDGENVYINNNTLTRLSNQYMPGPIDIEPNAFPYYTNKNIYVTNNSFSDTNGASGHISYFIPTNSYLASTPPQNFIFEGNIFTGNGRCFRGFNYNNIPLYLQIKNNICNTTREAFIFGFSGVNNYLIDAVISDNIFNCNNTISTNNTNILGNNVGAIQDTVKNVIFSNNINRGNSVSAGLIISANVDNCIIQGNEFDTSIDFGVRVGGGALVTITYMSFIGNTFKNIAGSGLSVQMDSDNPNAATCVWQGNMSPGGAGTCRFVATQFIDYSSASPQAIAAGRYAVGARSFNKTPAVGQPKSWVCTVAGLPGTWVSEGNL